MTRAEGRGPYSSVPPKSPLILLTGTYCAANKGNAAITIGTISALKQVLPEARVTLLTAFGPMDAAAYPGVSIAACSRRSPRIFILAGISLWRRLIKKRGGLTHILAPRSPELRHYLAADLIVDISGDSNSENYGLLVGLSHLMPLLVGVILGKKIIVWGQSLGPYRYLAPLARMVFNRTAAVTVREKLSLGYLRNLDVRGPRIEVTCDPAFLMQATQGEKLRQLLAREGLLPQNGPYLGVNASPLHGHKVSGLDPGKATTDFIDKLALACNRWIDTLPCKLVLLPHVTGPERRRDERAVVVELYRRISDKSRARPILQDYPTQDFKAIIAAMDLFVGVRMHSNIAALSSAVPVIALAYSHKTYGIMAMLDQERWTLDIRHFSAEMLIEKAQSAWCERDSIRKKLIASLPAAREAALRNAWLAKELLEGGKREKS